MPESVRVPLPVFLMEAVPFEFCVIAPVTVVFEEPLNVSERFWGVMGARAMLPRTRSPDWARMLLPVAR